MQSPGAQPPGHAGVTQSGAAQRGARGGRTELILGECSGICRGYCASRTLLASSLLKNEIRRFFMKGDGFRVDLSATQRYEGFGAAASRSNSAALHAATKQGAVGGTIPSSSL